MSKPLHRRHRIEKLEQRLQLDASMLQITEFVASNDKGLFDTEGDDPDWIEIYNSGSSAVDLTGLHLTDSGDELDKWDFPAGHTIDPGAFLVVFASGKDTEFAGGELHTNFKLSADGEFLALVDSDGVTVIDQFAPEFPEQQKNLSYGREMEISGIGVTLLAEGAIAAGLIPTNDNLGTSWTEVGFDDSSWALNGPTGFGYENNPGDSINYTDEIQTTIPSGLKSLYLRTSFTIASMADIGRLTLNMRYDDGFVAYINGVKIESANEPDVLTYNSAAGASSSDAESEQFVSFDVSSAIPLLHAGENVLAIHALNQSDTSSDFLISPEIVAYASSIALPETIGYFVFPTPGWGNAADSIIGYASEPTVSVPHGFYDSPQTVTLGTSTTDAIVVYTTDGSTPSVDENLNVTNGILYTRGGALTISATTVLRAITFKAGYQASPITTSSYLFLDDIIYQSPNGETPGPGWANGNVNGQDIDYGIDPEILSLYGIQAVKDSLASITTISISTDPENLFDPSTGIYVNAMNRGGDWERSASVELIDPEELEEGFTVNAGLRIRGGYSRNDFNPKHSFRLYFRSEYGDSKLEYDLFGDEGTDTFDVLDLRTAQNISWSMEGSAENTFLRDIFSRDLQDDLGHEFTRSRYHHLYIDGVYWGLYMTEERVQKDYAESYYGDNDEDYDIVKADNIDPRYTEVVDGNDDAWRQLFDLSNVLRYSARNHPDNYWTMQGLNPDGTRNSDLPVLLDVDNLADYMLMIFYTGGYDIGLSIYLGNNIGNNWIGLYSRSDTETGFQFFMHDNEFSLGSGNTETIDRTGPFNGTNQLDYNYFNPQFLHQHLLSIPEYQLAFADRVRTHFFDGGAMTSDASIARMMERKLEVDSAIIAESARWGDSKQNTPFNKSHWEAEYASIINNYFPSRTATVLSQLRGDNLYPAQDAPSYSQYGGTVDSGETLLMTVPSGTIYYTTDGSDPRVIGGAINAAATEYTGPLLLTTDQTVQARAYDSNGNWSALTTAAFEVLSIVGGDYNSDGLIDSADYTVWRDTLGQNVPNGTGADGDSNGVIEEADYDVWRNNYGTTIVAPATSTTAAAIPAKAVSIEEPVTKQTATDEGIAQLFADFQPAVAKTNPIHLIAKNESLYNESTDLQLLLAYADVTSSDQEEIIDYPLLEKDDQSADGPQSIDLLHNFSIVFTAT